MLRVKAFMKSGLLVLGMHRSGTSAVTGCLAPFGVSLSADLMPPDPRNASGFFESQEICALMDRFLVDCGSFWHDWRPIDLERVSATVQRDLCRNLTNILRRDFARSNVFAIKDPRNCRVVPIWLRVFSDLGIKAAVVITLRHPVCVALSLAERNGMPFDKALFLWLRHMLDAERETRFCPRTFVPYDDLLIDSRQQLLRIGAMIGADWMTIFDKNDRSNKSHLDAALRHHIPDSNSLAMMNAVGPWFDCAWRELSACAVENDVSDSRAALDDINRDFTDKGRYFSLYFAAAEAELSYLRGEKDRPYRTALGASKDSLRRPSVKIETRKAGYRLPIGVVDRSIPPKPGIVGFSNFVIVRSFDRRTATVRLQSEPILQGFLNAGNASVSIHIPGTSELQVHPSTCLIFHYDDEMAAEAIMAARPGTDGCLVICLGSDVSNYSDYTKLDEIVDLYIMPSELHQQTLQAQLFKPVYYLPECVDPIGLGPKDEGSPNSIVGRKRVLWFGYADSFYKSMASLLPVINQGCSSGAIDSFMLITDAIQFKRNYPNHSGYKIISYDNNTFCRIASEFDYCILSHFSLDLSMNTHIKSPNKLITALCAGLTPIASRTPNYTSILERFKLGHLLFSSPNELRTIINKLDPTTDRSLVRDSGAASTLRAERSPNNVYAGLLEILKIHGCRQIPAVEQLPMTYADATRVPNQIIRKAGRRIKRLFSASL